MFLLAVPATLCGAQERPCDPQAPLGPSHDLYCIELIPASGVSDVSGRIELASPPGPFTVAVTVDGRSRYTLIASLTGLSPAITYMAWATPPLMHPAIRLGEVKNGTTRLGAIELDKFVVLITAEPNARVRVPGQRLILRGQSPSTRLFPPDVLEFSIGGAGEGEHHTHAGSGAWPMVPMPPRLTMLPAEMALRPDVAPYLPSDTGAPMARRGERVPLQDGDTLRLEAGIVQRNFKGRTYTMYAFNGQYPGPLLEVARGSEVVVEFKNRLPDSTSIHWHGIRLDNAFDGVPEMTQPAVAPGGSFTYRIRFPDAGIYWYHPHVREDVQQELGLYGNMLVRASPQQEDSFPLSRMERGAAGAVGGEVNREEILMLDDLLVGESGPIPLGRESPTHALMGRFGNLFLVNGEPDYRLTVRRGEVVRFYLTNAASTRTFNLSFADARMKLVGSDAGLFEREAWVESVVIAPAERYVVDVRFNRSGCVALVNRVQGLDHLFGRFFAEVDTLGVVEVGTRKATPDYAASFAGLRRHPPPFAAFRESLDRAPDKVFVLTLETRDLPPVTERLMQLDSIYFAPVEWSGTMPMMNWAATGRQVRWILRDGTTGRENMDVDWHVQRGPPVKVRFVNERRAFHGMQHPIHVHGQRFLVLAVNGVPNENLVWKDTVLVPAGSVVDILLDTSNPGHWMVHCHIAEHLSAGMMAHLTVE